MTDPMLDWADRAGDGLLRFTKAVCGPLPGVLAVPVMGLILAVAFVAFLPLAVAYGLWRGGSSFISGERRA